MIEKIVQIPKNIYKEQLDGLDQYGRAKFFFIENHKLIGNLITLLLFIIQIPIIIATWSFSKAVNWLLNYKETKNSPDILSKPVLEQFQHLQKILNHFIQLNIDKHKLEKTIIATLRLLLAAPLLVVISICILAVMSLDMANFAVNFISLLLLNLPRYLYNSPSSILLAGAATGFAIATFGIAPIMLAIAAGVGLASSLIMSHDKLAILKNPYIKAGLITLMLIAAAASVIFTAGATIPAIAAIFPFTLPSIILPSAIALQAIIAVGVGLATTFIATVAIPGTIQLISNLTAPPSKQTDDHKPQITNTWNDISNKMPTTTENASPILSGGEQSTTPTAPSSQPPPIDTGIKPAEQNSMLGSTWQNL
jgi:hypothetical protein